MSEKAFQKIKEAIKDIRAGRLWVEPIDGETPAEYTARLSASGIDRNVAELMLSDVLARGRNKLDREFRFSAK